MPVYSSTGLVLKKIKELHHQNSRVKKIHLGVGDTVPYFHISTYDHLCCYNVGGHSPEWVNVSNYGGLLSHRTFSLGLSPCRHDQRYLTYIYWLCPIPSPEMTPPIIVWTPLIVWHDVIVCNTVIIYLIVYENHKKVPLCNYSKFIIMIISHVMAGRRLISGVKCWRNLRFVEYLLTDLCGYADLPRS